MAKKMKRLLAIALALTLCLVQMAVPAMAAGPGDWWWGGGFHPGGNNDSDRYEFYIVNLQGVQIATGAGEPGDVYYLGTHYEAGASVNGGILSWYIQPLGVNRAPYTGTANLADYVTIPEGYTVNDLQIEESTVSGVNDPNFDQYDNAVISITIKSLKKDSGEVVVLSAATVNHNYYTYDAYTDKTVKDGTTSGSFDALEGSSFTATPVTSYNGNEYAMTTDASNLTINVVADTSQNVITIDYLRTIDTTPVPVEADVIVNHNYYTYDIYTDSTALDGSTSDSYKATEGESFTATPITSYNGNDYSVTTDASDLTVTVVAEGNTININYVREIDSTPAPVETEVTVIHNYATYDIYTGETVSDGSTSGSFDALEHDSFTATPVTSYNGNVYEMTTDASALTITVNADASQNVITIDYLRTIDTTPKATSVTVYHYYNTYDVHTDETVADGSFVETFDATEFDVFTATPINAYGGNEYAMTTDASALSINVVADASKNEVVIRYIREIDTSPKATTVTVIHNYFTKDLYTGQTETDGDLTIIANATEKDLFTATVISQYEGNDYNMVTDEDALTITVKANDKKNVIEIDYLRTIDTTPADYEPVLTMVKSADKVSYEVGDTVTWTITVTNDSAYTAYNVTVIDEMTGDRWTIESLAPGASKSFTATTSAAAEGAQKNIAVATWEDNDEIDDADEANEITTVSDDATVTVYEPTPAPQPEPEPAPAPAPQPEPEPAPAPAPAPQPEPEAAPAPAPQPEPEAAPAPAPQPEPEAAPAPAPQPEPEAAPAPAPQPEPEAAPAPAPAAGAMLIDIFDEDVPLADVPKTGDATLLWVILSMISGGGVILMNRKED